MVDSAALLRLLRRRLSTDSKKIKIRQSSANASTTFRTLFATTSREFSSQRRRFRAMYRKLSILHHCGNDGLRGLREHAERHAQHASASRDSNHRFAHACRAAQVHPAESRETDTCRCNELRKGIAK